MIIYIVYHNYIKFVVTKEKSMPDILTHIIFSKNIKNKIDNPKIVKLINDNINLFQLGAQGPDFLFYYKPFSPFSKKISKVGHSMHKIETANFFVNAIKKLEKLEGENYENLLVYILGFICHYYLDKTVHPYVNYIDKYGIWDYKGNIYPITHYYIEYTLDIRLWKKFENRNAYETDNSTEKNPKKCNRILRGIYMAISKCCYKKKTYK